MSFFQVIRSKFSRQAPPPPIPRGFVPLVRHIPDETHEAEELPHDSGLIGQSFGLVYRAADGELTRRRITVRKFCQSASGNGLVRAFCWERHALRSFRIDRIESLYRLDTGEVIEHPAELLSHIPARTEATDETAKILNEVRPGLRALLFLSRCDGERIEEREAMRWYVEQRAKGRPFDWDQISAFLDRQHPDRHLAAQAIVKVLHNPAEVQCLMKAAGMLVDSDGEFSPEETHVLMDLTELAHEAEH